MTNNVITLDQVSFSYQDDKPILKNLSMTIAAGKVTAIMGGSGSGKTTVLRLMSGQLTTTTGQVMAFDADLASLNRQQLQDYRKRIGMLFQFGALFTDMSVAENVAFPLYEHSNLSPSLIKKIVAMKLAAVGLSGTQDLMPNELSGGMARRVALARSTALDPEIMLYDEPFTGLDPISLNTSAMLIKNISQRLGQTVVIVTHDIAATMEIADYMYFMANGEVIASGSPQEMRASQNPAVQQFISGAVDGPFEYKYPSPCSYESYLGIA